MLYLNIFRRSRILRASNAPGFFAGGKGCSYHTQNECVLLHKSVWGMHERGHKLELTWLESPVQFSGMSQSFTASLHTTPLNSICRSAQLKDQLVGLRSFYPIRCSSDAKCCVPGNRCSRGRCYTWSLGSACTCYSRPRLVCHTPNKDRCHLLIKPAFYGRDNLRGKTIIVNYIKSANSETHHWAATVTLLSLLH